MTRLLRPTGPRTRRILNLLATLALVAAAAGWALFLRPPALGGTTTFVVVSGNSMEPGLHNGDLVLVRQQESYSARDVVAYRVPRGEPGAGSTVIHRILRGTGDTGFRLQGDNRSAPDLWRPVADDIVGTAVVQLPHLGRVLVFLASPWGLASGAGAFAFLLVMSGTGRTPTRDGGPPELSHTQA